MRAFALLAVSLVAAAQGANLLYPKGCSDASKANYWPDNPDSEAACWPQATVYCPDPLADNYDAASPSWSDSTSNAYKPYSVALPAHCTYNVYGCTDPAAANYQSVVPTAAGNQWAVNSDMCQYAGCNDTDAMNWNSQATFNDGTCIYGFVGCTDPTAVNYNSAFTES